MNKRRRRTKRVDLSIIMACVSGAFLLWIGASYIDVVMHNLNTEPVYQAWNIFPLLFK